MLQKIKVASEFDCINGKGILVRRPARVQIIISVDCNH